MSDSFKSFTYKVPVDPEIPQEYIDECERLTKETGETMFILDEHLNTDIKIQLGDKQAERDLKLERVLEIEEPYVISGIEGFSQLPSRFAYYDTETKLCGRYKRYQYVEKWILDLGFVPSQTNFGPEYEQSFNLELSFKILTIRVQPNLFMTIFGTTALTTGSGTSFLYGYQFFNKSLIFESIKKFDSSYANQITRDKLIDEVIPKLS